MKPPAHRTYDLFAVQSATERAKTFIDNTLSLSKRLVEDPEAKERIRSHMCRWCFYAGRQRLVGQALTDYTCAKCRSTSTHANTGVPVLCEICAGRCKLCKQCMGDREGIVRKKLP
jgi:hypothetical protein